VDGLELGSDELDVLPSLTPKLVLTVTVPPPQQSAQLRYHGTQGPRGYGHGSLFHISASDQLDGLDCQDDVQFVTAGRMAGQTARRKEPAGGRDDTVRRPS